MITTILIILGILFAVMIAATIIRLAVIAKQHTPESKGNSGEKAVAKVLGGTVAGKQYLINDLLFEISGHTCQIDHIFINHNGIWVIETKNYAGAICGDDSVREWTQILGNGSTINQLLNPVKQNATHIYRLKEYLKTDLYLFNAVVFLDRADLTNVKSDCVYSIYNLLTIKERETGVTLSPEQMEYFYNALTRLKETSTVSKAEHIESIREMQKNIQNGLCPRCGSNLVLRNGKNGEFYGCTGYPKCTFTMPKEESILFNQ